MTPVSHDPEKRRVAEAAARLVEPGMCLGLGSGSTAEHFVEALGRRVAAGELAGLRCVATSQAVRRLGEAAGLPLTTLEQDPVLDLTVDGADQVDPRGDLLKGLGGALLREKIVASVSRRYVVIVDGSKCTEQLGSGVPVVVEVLPFGWTAAHRALEAMGGAPVLRQRGGRPVETDQGNVLLDCDFGMIADPPALARSLDALPAILGHGLFLGMATDILVGRQDGVERRPGPRGG